MYICIFILFHMFNLWIVYNYVVCILLYFFCLPFISLYMIYLCSFCPARFLGVDIMQMLAHMRVCVLPCDHRPARLFPARFGGSRGRVLACAIVYTNSMMYTIQSFSVHVFPLFMAFLMRFPLVFVA